MGSSKAAELNHYPRPAHVLADSSRLELTDRQKAETQSVFDAMSAVAKRSVRRSLPRKRNWMLSTRADKQRREPSRIWSPSCCVCKPSFAMPT